MSPRSTLCKFIVLWLLLPGIVAPMRLAADTGMLQHRRKAFRTTGGATYLLQETFNPTGYVNSFTEAGSGTVDEDYTTTTIYNSTQCLYLSASTQTPQSLSPTFATSGTTYFYFLMHPVTLPPTSAYQVFRVRNSGSSVATLSINTTGTFRVTATGGTIQTTTDAMSTGTTYHCFLSYTPGTGTNAILTFGFSTDGTRPTSGNKYKECTNGTSTAVADQISFGYNSTNSGTFIFDNLFIDDAVISSAPTP